MMATLAKKRLCRCLVFSHFTDMKSTTVITTVHPFKLLVLAALLFIALPTSAQVLPDSITRDTTLCRTQDFQVYNMTTRYWKQAWRGRLCGIGQDTCQLPAAALYRYVPATKLKNYLDRCPDCEETRVFFLGNRMQKYPFAPDLAIGNVRGCQEVYGSNPEVLVSKSDTNFLAHPSDLLGSLLEWFEILREQKAPYNATVYAYTYDRATLYNLADTASTDSIYAEYSYHSSERIIPKAPQQGQMILDLLMGSSLKPGKASALYDIATPCPPVCGDTTKARRQYLTLPR